MNSCTFKAQPSSGNRIRTALLGNGNVDAKRLFVLRLAFRVEMLHYYFVFKRHAEEREMR